MLDIEQRNTQLFLKNKNRLPKITNYPFRNLMEFSRSPGFYGCKNENLQTRIVAKRYTKFNFT